MRRRAGNGVEFLILLAGAMAASGCVPLSGGWSPDVLDTLDPAIELPEGHRLADTAPHFWPQGDRVWLFLCRFDTTEAIRFALPKGASADELADLRLAFEIWERSVGPVRFREVGAAGEGGEDEAQIVVRYDDAASRGAEPIRGTGLTVTDCEVARPKGPVPSEPSRIDAGLVRATIFLRRSNPDTIGREIPLLPDARLGAALHEIGHALGFGGHSGDPDSILTTTTERMRVLAKRLRAGEPLSEPSLAALYAIPNGIVVGETTLTERAREELAAARGIAAARQWRGPFVRVGDPNAQLHYRKGEAMAGRLAIVDYARKLRAGNPLEFSPTSLVRFIRSKRAASPR